MTDELRKPASETDISNPRLAQPICTALQVALVGLMASWNITPRAVVGHSSGEISAAYSQGSLSKSSSLRVAYYRGEAAAMLANEYAGRGGMLAVALSEKDVAPYIKTVMGDDQTGRLSCGCVNSPRNITATGPDIYINRLAELLNLDRVFNRKLDVPVAYHSLQMLEVAEEYRNSLAGTLISEDVNPSAKFPVMISSVTGEVVNQEYLQNPKYWVQNLVSKVRFFEALKRAGSSSTQEEHGLQSKSLSYVIEIGPHPALERSVREIFGGEIDYAYASTLRRGISSIITMQRLGGNLVAHNHPINMQSLNMSSKVRRSPKMLLDLPPYPFNHSRTYWLESRLSRNRRQRGTPRHDFLGVPSADWNPLKPKWRFTIRTSDLPWVVDHKVCTRSAS